MSLTLYCRKGQDTPLGSVQLTRPNPQTQGKYHEVLDIRLTIDVCVCVCARLRVLT